MQLKSFIAGAVQSVLAEYKKITSIIQSRILPIKKIDGMTVTVRLTFCKWSHQTKTSMTLEVATEKINIMTDNCVEDMRLYQASITEDCEKMDLDAAAEEIKTQLSDLKFNKYCGSFQRSADFSSEPIDDLAEIGNIEMDYDKCCVCRDATLTKTTCGHHLCVECWISLKKLKCPICRDCIKYLDLGQDDDDEDDE